MRKIVVGIAFILLGKTVYGNDTPFVYLCLFNNHTFEVEFSKKNPTAQWVSPLMNSRVKFTLGEDDTAEISITTGLPVLGNTIPEQYEFLAPLQTDRFQFKVRRKEATDHLALERVVLSCQR